MHAGSREQDLAPTPGQVSVYRWLALNDWQWDPVRACSDLEMSADEAQAGLRRCVDAGLLREDPTIPGRHVAVDPDLVATVMATPIEQEIRERQERLRSLREGLGALRLDYLDSRRRSSGLVEHIPGIAGVRAFIEQASEECRSEILSSQPGGNRVPEAMQEAMARDIRQVKRGIRIRTLYHHTARFDGPSQAYVAAMSGLGAEYRTVHKLFGRLIIFDHESVLLPDIHGSGGAVLARETSIVHYLREVFEQTWEDAKPFSDAASDGLQRVAEEIDSTIVGLLGAGLKDETIGRRLGMSLRTVRRHVADIMQELGAESRFQAGVRAAQTGMLAAGDLAGTDTIKLPDS
ncbi:helix-turn-helix transcriptional regulator [Actinoplanes rectilineatus]|uniref:helix-turn-helix transcriptional regulator n=1 Tax=Actinoplanes rectilineatus TaxID=113571 RepID=UPI0005F2C556|nr:LuxR family transcriptional regulator [Actinoplanes rectilineatus]